MKYVLTYTFECGSSFINEPGMSGYYPNYETRREEFTTESAMRQRYEKIKNERMFSGFKMELTHELLFSAAKVS